MNLPGEVEQIIQDIDAISSILPQSTYMPNCQISEDILHARYDQCTLTIPCNDFTDSLLDALWSAEDPFPILITGATAGLQLDLDPAFFIKTFYNFPCEVQNCTTGEIIETTVDAFFSLYGHDSDSDYVLRMKVRFFAYC